MGVLEHGLVYLCRDRGFIERDPLLGSPGASACMMPMPELAAIAVVIHAQVLRVACQCSCGFGRVLVVRLLVPRL